MMRIKHRYVFQNSDKKTLKFLDKYGVVYKLCETLAVIDLYEDSIHYYKVANFLSKHKIHQSLWETVYTQKEMDDAEWLTCRSTWRNGYPQPDQENMGYRFSTYNSEDYCDLCGKGLVQKENFMLRKEPNWGPRNFMMLNWVHDEIFISSKALSVLKKAGLSGFSPFDVISKSGDVFSETKQILVDNYLDFGLNNESVENVLFCSKCGCKRYMLKPGFIYYDKKCFDSLQYDIVKTQEKFGEITNSSLIIISQRFYRILKESKIERGLAFKPLILI